ncbi:MAG: methylated-DNA--[protein]-cysteine S-methyltransferase [Dehalococcoidales bacterium]|nr:MAG: methylated-DNA--[protein]-cysteine S-methyltransferase [Dehalococcoidales bacterium]
MKYRIIDTAFGYVGIAATGKGVSAVTLPRDTEEEAVMLLGEKSGNGDMDPELLPNLMERITNYFDGEKVSFPDELDLTSASEFQKKVWQAACLIPYGETRSYLWVATQAGNPRASRAAGRALGRNPLPIIIPCHRVIAGNGGMGGFTGGIEMKMRLLALESSGS